MKHGFGFRKLGRKSSHRHSMFRNMVTSLIEHERIRTTVPKAKEVSKYAEKMITIAKKGGHEAFRQAHMFVRTNEAVNKLVRVLGPRYANRHGGYTRILKCGHRFGDWASMCYLEYVDNNLQPLRSPKEKGEKKLGVEEAQIVESQQQIVVESVSTRASESKSQNPKSLNELD